MPTGGRKTRGRMPKWASRMLGAGNLLREPRTGTEHQQGIMVIRMIADGMAPQKDLPDQRRILLRLLAYDKKGRR